VLTFGFGETADVRISNLEYRTNQGEPLGISFKLRHAGSTVPVKIDNCFGNATAYAAAAAAAVGLAFGMNLVRITETLSSYVAPEHRMRLIPGVKHTNILDDTYNASPLSMSEAIETAAALPGRRKVAVLGDMLEIGRYAVEAHEAIGERIGKTFDLLVTVGPRARFIASAAIERGFPRERAFSFDDAKEAGRALQDLIEQGDLILIKASRAMALERIVEEVREIPPPPPHPA
jgi:UDP-N-acetylmuramoyl-tripeptide--D-alanyl-D-alanine ligase